MVSKLIDTNLTLGQKTDWLVERGMSLFSTILFKAEKDAEEGQPDADTDFTGLPGVPTQEPPRSSKQKALEALGQVAGMLNQILEDEDLARQLDDGEKERAKLVSQWIEGGLEPLSEPEDDMELSYQFNGDTTTPISRMLIEISKAADLRLSVKAIVKGPFGAESPGRTLVLKDAGTEWWDLPGGHVQDGETLRKALDREVLEETGLHLARAREYMCKVLTLGEETKPVVFYKAAPRQGEIRLSDEHTGYTWADDTDISTLNLGVFKGVLIPGGDDTSIMRPGHEIVGQKGAGGQIGAHGFDGGSLTATKNAPPDHGSNTGLMTDEDTDMARQGEVEPNDVNYLEDTGTLREEDQTLGDSSAHGGLWNKGPEDSNESELEHVLGCDDTQVIDERPDGDRVLEHEGQRYYLTGDGQLFEKKGVRVTKVLKMCPEHEKSRQIAAQTFGPDYEVLEERSDGDLMIEANGIHYYVTPQGGVFEKLSLMKKVEDDQAHQPAPGWGSNEAPEWGAQEVVKEDMPWEGYTNYGGGDYDKLMLDRPDLNNDEFMEHVITRNHADRDSGELNDIAMFELLRLAGTWHSEAPATPATEDISGSEVTELDNPTGSRITSLAWGMLHKSFSGELVAEILNREFGSPFLAEGMVKAKATSGGGLIVKIGSRDVHFDEHGCIIGDGTELDGEVSMEKEGGGIGGAGDSMVGADVHTDTAGGHRTSEQYASHEPTPEAGEKTNDWEKGRVASQTMIDPGSGIPERHTLGTNTGLNKWSELAKALDIPIVERTGVKFKKAVLGDPGLYDIKVIHKGLTGRPHENRYIIAGYASPVMVDLEGHQIEREALERDLPRFMADDGSYANVNVMHSNVTVGKILSEFSLPDGKVLKTTVDTRGLFVVAEIRTDPAAPEVCKQIIQDIEKGVLKSFSISGHATNPVFTCDGDRCFYSIKDLQLYEITLCEEGVNPEAKFEVVSKALLTKAYRGIPIVRKVIYDEKGESLTRIYPGIPIIRKHETPTGVERLHAPDFEDDTEKSTGDAYSEPNPEANSPLFSKAVNEADLLRYFSCFSNLFNMYHHTGRLQVVLYDPSTGEVILSESDE